MKTLQPGQQIDNLVNGITYSIEAHLATGGFGAAYRARKLGGKRGEPASVCLKLTDDARSWHGESYFAALLSDFAHAVTMYDAFPTEIRVGRAKKLVFAIEMELIDSGTVARAADEGRLGWTEQRVAKKMRGLLQPLQALHNMQVSHRDITPNNVFIGNRAQLKLGDLGIAKAGLKAQGARLESSAPMYFLPARRRGVVASGRRHVPGWATDDDPVDRRRHRERLQGHRCQSGDVEDLWPARATERVFARSR